jgi:hypothetical protein
MTTGLHVANDDDDNDEEALIEREDDGRVDADSLMDGVGAIMARRAASEAGNMGSLTGSEVEEAGGTASTVWSIT